LFRIRLEAGNATGGRAFVLPNLKRLDALFARIQDELRTEYSVAFHNASSPRCGYPIQLAKPHNSKLCVRGKAA
jgi:hypothetical protein